MYENKGQELMMKKLNIVDLGMMTYSDAIEVMERVRDDVEKIEDDTLLLVEHPTVITIGRDGDDSSIVDKAYIDKHNIPVVHADRGGKAVVHNKGQLVVYPVIKVTDNPIDILFKMMDVMESTLIAFGLKITRHDEPGAWIDDQKIAFFGMSVEHGVLVHGAALNIFNDLNPFNAIKTCGRDNERVTNLVLKTKNMIDIESVKMTLVSRFSRQLGYLPDRFIG